MQTFFTTYHGEIVDMTFFAVNGPKGIYLNIEKRKKKKKNRQLDKNIYSEIISQIKLVFYILSQIFICENMTKSKKNKNIYVLPFLNITT